MAEQDLVNPFGSVTSDPNATGFGTSGTNIEDILSSESSILAGTKAGLEESTAQRKNFSNEFSQDSREQLLALTGHDIFVDESSDEVNLKKSIEESQRLRDADQLSTDLLAAKRGGNEEDILKASQESLRLKEFEQTIGDTLEAEQLAQRTLFREQQNIARQQATFEAGAQSAAASLQNRAAQTGASNSSAIQGMVSSINTQRGVGVSDFQTQVGDLKSDSQRISQNLQNDLTFLNETFDLGGDINLASQGIADNQARAARRAGQKQQSAQIGSALGTALGGPLGGALGGAVGGLFG